MMTKLRSMMWFFSVFYIQRLGDSYFVFPEQLSDKILL